uniref:Coenzyme Q-binding protein COQ10 START domain-containing protein n=1 Tax=Araucaria cunninghamii TaxID=56994 RepID=A0A0D6QSV4_ARACU
MECLTFSWELKRLPHFTSKTPHLRPIPHSNLKSFRATSKGSHPIPTKSTQLRKTTPICRAGEDFTAGRDENEEDEEGEDNFATIRGDEGVEDVEEDDIELRIERAGKNSRRITARIEVDAPLDAVWNVLTDYEKLADFIPGLAVCKLLERGDKSARLFQIGQQNLVFGLKFNAKGIIDVYENDLEAIPIGMHRDIDFMMVEGDFEVFEGKWAIEQVEEVTGNQNFSDVKRYRTFLSYIVNVQPKRWLPVALVEGRLSKEIQLNLTCVRNQAIRTAFDALAAL